MKKKHAFLFSAYTALLALAACTAEMENERDVIDDSFPEAQAEIPEATPIEGFGVVLTDGETSIASYRTPDGLALQYEYGAPDSPEGGLCMACLRAEIENCNEVTRECLVAACPDQCDADRLTLDSGSSR